MKNESIRTNLAKGRGLGSARNGTEHWYMQRITAIANIPLSLWIVWSFLSLIGASYDEFTIWLAYPLNAILMIIFVLNVFYHAYLGIQVVIEDYISNEAFKTVKLIGVKLFFFAASVAAIFSILKIAL